MGQLKKSGSNNTTNIMVWLGIIIFILVPSLVNMDALVRHWWLNQDKHFHLAVFTLFVIATRLLFQQVRLVYIIGVSVAFSLAIELLQDAFTHGHRRFDLGDIYFNLFGIALGLAVLWVFKRHNRANPNT